MPSLPRTIALGAITASFASAGVAVAQDNNNLAYRAVGQTALTLNSTTINGIGLFCVKAGENKVVGCNLEATGRMTVSAATKAKYKLPSALIAKGVYAKAGEGGSIQMKASSAMRARLKKAKVKKLPVSYSIKVTGPGTETFSKKVTMTVGSSVRLFIRSSGDTAAIDGTDSRG
jgi:hypothetical protein